MAENTLQAESANTQPASATVAAIEAYMLLDHRPFYSIGEDADLLQERAIALLQFLSASLGVDGNGTDLNCAIQSAALDGIGDLLSMSAMMRKFHEQARLENAKAG